MFILLCMQGEVVHLIKGAAMLSHALLQCCHSNPPEKLLSTTVMLHDNCLLVGDMNMNLYPPHLS
jgi:hypothetical protein